MTIAMRLPRALATVAVTALLALTATAVFADDFEVNPIIVSLSSTGQRTADITITNNSAEAIRFSLGGYSWTQSPAGEMQLSSTDDLVFFPEIFTIAPHGIQLLRIGIRTPPATIEGAYRLNIEEMPAPRRAAAGAALTIMMRVGVPVFYAPLKAAAAERAIGTLSRNGDALTIDLNNLANVHVAPSSLVVTFRDGSGNTVEQVSQPVWYVLANGSRRVQVKIPPNACEKARSVSMQWRVEGTPTVISQPSALTGCR